MLGYPTWRKTCSRRTWRGFTVSELLVTTAIIGLLAALLFPAFSRVWQGAQRSSCQSNLKQIGLAMHQYTQDYDGIFPTQDQTPGAEKTFALLLQPYIENGQMFICPSSSGRETTSIPGSENPLDTNWKANGFVGSYSMNALVQNVAISQIHKPELTALFVDNRTFSDYGFYPHLQFCGRHLGGVNVDYVDGHVKWLGLQASTDLNFFTE